MIFGKWSINTLGSAHLLNFYCPQGDILNPQKSAYEDTTDSFSSILNGKKKRESFPSNFFGLWVPSLSLSVRDRAKEIEVNPVPLVIRPHTPHEEDLLHKDCERLTPFLPIPSLHQSRLLPQNLQHHFIGPGKRQRITFCYEKNSDFIFQN